MPNNLSYDSLGELDPKSDLLWTIETEALSSFSYSLMRSNILALCVEDPFVRLRQLLIELQPPIVQEKQIYIEAQKEHKEELKGLNSEQRQAVVKALKCEEYHLVKGVPGSGKSRVLATLVKLLTAAKKRILLVSHSNQTIDSTLLKLKEQGFSRFLRVTSNLSSVDPKVRDHVRLANKFTSYEDIKEVIDNFQVFAMTCM